MRDPVDPRSQPIRPRTPSRQWLAAQTRRLGTYLGTAYPQTAANALLQLLAILLGFMVGTSWSIRESDRRELARHLEVLIPWQEEVNFLSKQVEGLARKPPDPCTVSFETPRWDDMIKSGYTLRLKSELYKQARQTYNDLALAPQHGRGMRLQRCQKLLAELGAKIEELGTLLDKHISGLKLEESRLAGQLTTGGLLLYAGGLVALGTAVLLLPLVVYWLGIAAVRVIR